MRHLTSYDRLFEKKQVGIIYHFTDIFALKDITENWSNWTPSLKFTEDDFYDDNSFFISTTRKFDFKWGPIRLTLDGNKISDKYQIAPVSYFSKKPNDVKTDPRQFEERIISTKQDELPLLKYCKQIDICTDPKYDFYADDVDDDHDDLLSHQDDVDHAYSYFSELGLSINIVEKFKPIR